jgi:ribonuclease-3
MAEQLYKSNKYFSEGELTRRRAQLVNNTFLAEKAIELGLGQFLMLGRGESMQNGAENPTNLANALEALIGAVYLDSDLDTVRMFILNNLFEEKYQF